FTLAPNMGATEGRCGAEVISAEQSLALIERQLALIVVVLYLKTLTTARRVHHRPASGDVFKIAEECRDLRLVGAQLLKFGQAPLLTFPGKGDGLVSVIHPDAVH